VIDALLELGGYIMLPLYYVTSFVLLAFHRLFGGIFGPESGVAWVLSIIGLTLVIRAALIPLFVKQIKSSRNMQLIQPKVRELQKKYGHDRERLAQETMKLYRESGTNPFASCLPILMQMPIFLALFRLIDQAAQNPGETRGLMTEQLNHNFGDAVFLGARISETFLGTDSITVRILAAVLVIAMTATTFTTQRQLMSKNMPSDAMSGPYAQQQKMLLYVLPLVFGVGGIAFPIGVLFYWTTSNLWTMGQQFYVIRNNPAPGTPALKAKQERDARKAARRAERRGVAAPEAAERDAKTSTGDDADDTTASKQPSRQQPKKKSRSQRKKQQPGAQRNPSQKKQPGEPDTPPA
jgi:YidC/Oxa1 family membrane protein insertase